MEQKGFGEEGWQLDKDLLVPDNRLYSPESCVFLPATINAGLVGYTKESTLVVKEGHSCWSVQFTGSDSGVKYVKRFSNQQEAHEFSCSVGRFDRLYKCLAEYRHKLDPRAVSRLDELFSSERGISRVDFEDIPRSEVRKRVTLPCGRKCLWCGVVFTQNRCDNLICSTACYNGMNYTRRRDFSKLSGKEFLSHLEQQIEEGYHPNPKHPLNLLKVRKQNLLDAYEALSVEHGWSLHDILVLIQQKAPAEP